MNIREYIINNFKNDDKDIIMNAINESINENDEVTLPGLGIFFILNWESIDDNEKNKIVDNIYNKVKRG